MYNKHMKRTNLVLDEEMLEKAVLLMGAKTYSEAVNRALEESIKLYHVRGLAGMAGSGVWEGDLSEMRDDCKVASPEKKYKRSKKKKRKK